MKGVLLTLECYIMALFLKMHNQICYYYFLKHREVCMLEAWHIFSSVSDPCKKICEGSYASFSILFKK